MLHIHIDIGTAINRFAVVLSVISGVCYSKSVFYVATFLLNDIINQHTSVIYLSFRIFETSAFRFLLIFTFRACLKNTMHIDIY